MEVFFQFREKDQRGEGQTVKIRGMVLCEAHRSVLCHVERNLEEKKSLCSAKNSERIKKGLSQFL